MTTPTEQLRAFIERVKGEHRTGKGAGDSDAWPNDALRAVLALEEMLAVREVDEAVMEKALDALESDANLKRRRAAFEAIQDRFEESTLARAAQKIQQ